MFFLNLGHSWNLASDIEGIKGVILLPAHTYSPRFTTHKFDHSRVLFDPQLYLATLEKDLCALTCARLSSYPWFMIKGLPDISDFKTTTEWQREMKLSIQDLWPAAYPSEADIYYSCELCLSFQAGIGCSYIILPSPLISEREDEVELQAKWLDEGLRVVEDLDLGHPVLTTVALAETAINEEAFEPAGFLDTIVDQITAREGLSGVYIVISRSQLEHPFLGADNVNKAYLRLCERFRDAGLVNIIVNFADVFGVACTAYGATGFATGQSYPLRQMSLSAYRERRGGLALPYLYSHQCIAEYLSETHLDVIVENKLLRRVRDNSPHSIALMQRLTKGGSASTIASWAESRSNCTAANMHFIHRMNIIGSRLAGKDTLEDRFEYVRGWLEDAEANTMYIHNKLGKGERDEQLGRVAPSDKWLDLFDAQAEEE